MALDEVVAQYWNAYLDRQGPDTYVGDPTDDYDAVFDLVQEGDVSVVGLLVALADAAQTDHDVGLIGAGPIEELLSVHSGRLRTSDGAALLDAIDTAARRNARFRQALRSAFMGDEVPAAVKDRLAKYRT